MNNGYIARPIIRKFMKDSKHTMVEFCRITDSSVQNLNNKLSRNSIRFNEVMQIADVFGYELKFVEKGSEKNQDHIEVHKEVHNMTRNNNQEIIQDIQALALQLLNRTVEQEGFGNISTIALQILNKAAEVDGQ